MGRDRRWDGLVRNPAAPAEVLIRLSADERLRRAMIWRRSALPRAVVDHLARHDDPAVRAMLAYEHRPLPMEVVESLAGDADSRVRLAVATRWDGLGDMRTWRYTGGTCELAPAHVYEALAADPDSGVRYPLQWNPDVPQHLLPQMATLPEAPFELIMQFGDEAAADAMHRAWLTSPEPRRRHSALRERRPPADLVDQLITDPETRVTAAQVVPLSRQRAVELANDADPRVREAVARNPDLPPELLSALASDPDPEVRRAVVDVSDLPVGLLETLAVDVDHQVRLAVVCRPDVPEELRDRVQLDIEQGDRTRRIPWLIDGDLDTALRYVGSPQVVIRRSVAMHPDLPPDAVAKLATDPDFAVRLLLAETHHDAPAELLAELLETWDGYSSWNLVCRPQLPAHVIERFATSTNPHHRRLALASGRLDAATVSALSHDPDHYVRGEAAESKVLPLERVMALLEDPDPYVRERAARNEQLPVETMLNLLVGFEP